MDIATIVGLIATVTVLMVGIGSNLSTMLDAPSAIIVVGGTLASLLVSFPLKDIVGPMLACNVYVFIPPQQMTPEVERNLSVGIEIFRRAGTYASAFGWVGVLVGLAIMSRHGALYDLERLGPGFSICILTALYGTVLHYLVFVPIRTKLSRIQADLAIQAS